MTTKRPNSRAQINSKAQVLGWEYPRNPAPLPNRDVTVLYTFRDVWLEVTYTAFGRIKNARGYDGASYVHLDGRPLAWVRTQMDALTAKSAPGAGAQQALTEHDRAAAYADLVAKVAQEKASRSAGHLKPMADYLAVTAPGFADLKVGDELWMSDKTVRGGRRSRVRVLAVARVWLTVADVEHPRWEIRFVRVTGNSSRTGDGIYQLITDEQNEHNRRKTEAIDVLKEHGVSTGGYGRTMASGDLFAVADLLRDLDAARKAQAALAATPAQGRFAVQGPPLRIQARKAAGDGAS